MFCPNCGKELSEGAAFCPECGNALRAAAPATTDADQATSAPADAGQATPVTADAGQAAPAKKKKKKKGPIVAIVLFLLIAAAGATGFVLWNNDNFRCWLDVREASKMYEADDYESAVEAYQRALDRVEDSSEAIDGLMRVAKSYYKQENYEEALAIYDLILERDPENQKALSGQRDCYLTQGETALKNERYDKALDYYKKAQKINKTLDSDEGNETIRDGQLQAYSGLAQQSLASREYSKAREYLNYILTDADRSSNLYDWAKINYAEATLSLGQDSFLLGDYTAAETYYREILREETVGSLAYQGLADIYVAKADVEGAISMLEEGISYHNDSSIQEKLEALRESVSPYPIMKDAKGNKYDLGGATVYIYSWLDEGESDTPYWDARRKYREWAQKEYNFTMVWTNEGSWDSFNDLADLASGAKDTEGQLRMYMLPANRPEVMTAMKSNLMWNLSSLGVFDFSERRFKQNGISDLYRMNGNVYACSALPPEPRTGMFFNATLLKQLTGITADEMYDLQAKGEWTWEMFEKICENIYRNGDINGDGVQDIYAIAANTEVLTNALVSSNASTFFKLNSEGKFEYMVDSPATQEALEFNRKIRNAKYYYNRPKGAAQDYYYAAFDEQGKFVFLPDQAYLFNDGQRLNVNELPNAGEYGFLMFPIGPSAGGKHVNTYEDNIMVIPKCYNEAEAKTIAVAYDIYMADVVPGYIGYNFRLDDYEAGVHDYRTLDETLIRMMGEGANIDASALLDVSPVVGEGNREIWDPSKSVSKVTAEYESMWKSAIEEYNNR